MTDNDFYIEHLQRHNIKATATRLLVLRQLFRNDEMVSLADLEHALHSVDKSTISRTLALFLRQRLIHAIDDGQGATKYALGSTTTEQLPKGHIHFACTACHRTFCLKQIHTPTVALPTGFTIEQVNYVVKGVCPECTRKNDRHI